MNFPQPFLYSEPEQFSYDDSDEQQSSSSGSPPSTAGLTAPSYPLPQSGFGNHHSRNYTAPATYDYDTVDLYSLTHGSHPRECAEPEEIDAMGSGSETDTEIREKGFRDAIHSDLSRVKGWAKRKFTGQSEGHGHHGSTATRAVPVRPSHPAPNQYATTSAPFQGHQYQHQQYQHQHQQHQQHQQWMPRPTSHMSTPPPGYDPRSYPHAPVFHPHSTREAGHSGNYDSHLWQ
ncbi:hypothetical protein FRB95_013796, partial [Tulasnella sp. JGI-2019a]